MKSISYYFPIKAQNLAHYFAKACIVPVRYLENRINDVQGSYPNSLLLCTHQTIKDSGCDCSLELILTEEEMKASYPISQDCVLFTGVLPITRVKSILFVDVEMMNNVCSLININTAFIPVQLLKKVTVFSEAEMPDLQQKEKGKDWSKVIRAFDQILGGLALMRIVTGGENTFSDNYLSMLSCYNQAILNVLQKQHLPIKVLYHETYHQLLNKYITFPVTQTVLGEIAHIERQKILRNAYSNAIELSHLQGATYVMACLSTYKVSDHDEGQKKIDHLIMNRFSNIRNSEEVAFYYGLNRGYSIFNKSYGEVDFKYKLNSKLDYYTIEGVYKNIFKEVQIVEFPYLDDWCPALPISEGTQDNCYIFDVPLKRTVLPAVGSNEYWKSLFNSYAAQLREVVFKGNLEEVLKRMFTQVVSDKNKEYARMHTPAQGDVVSEPASTYVTTQMLARALRYKEMERKELEEIAKNLGMDFEATTSTNDLILMIINKRYA